MARPNLSLTPFLSYQDDGKLSTITTFDAATGGNIVNQVKYTYDGWGNIIEDQQSHSGAVTTGTPAVNYGYDDGADQNGNAQYVQLSSVTDPAGRVIYYLYDTTPSGRLSSLSENAGGTEQLVAYTYLGMNTIVTESHPQVSGGLNLSYGANGTYAGWDRFGRIVSQEWRTDADTLVDGYTYTYDRGGDRTSKGNELNSDYSEVYTYDGLSRLVDATRDETDLQDWTLDALGNWSSFTDDGTTQTRTDDAANEITGISGQAGWVTPTYDAAGNMISGPIAGNETVRQFYVYDAWNRLVAIKADNNGEPGSTVATYQYDGRGYRTQKAIAGGDTFDYYYNDSNQIIEVRKNGSANAYEQYVWDQRYIDAPVMVYRDTNTDGTVDQKLYVTQDANFDVMATINGNTGAIVNRFVYTPYGQRTVLTAAWTAGTTDFMLGHQGLMLDVESGAYYDDIRYYLPQLGTFDIRDLGYFDGANLYQYVRSNPLIYTDPQGLKSETCQTVGPPVFGAWKYVGTWPGTCVGKTGSGKGAVGGAICQFMGVYKRPVYELTYCCDMNDAGFFKWHLTTQGGISMAAAPGDTGAATWVGNPVPISIGYGKTIDIGKLLGATDWYIWAGPAPTWGNHPQAPGTIDSIAPIDLGNDHTGSPIPLLPCVTCSLGLACNGKGAGIAGPPAGVKPPPMPPFPW